MSIVCLVDEGVLDIIKLFWDQGCHTINSCQNNFGKVWIEIDLESFKKLLLKMQYSNKNELSDYFLLRCENKIQWDPDTEYFYKKEDECHILDGNFFSVSIRFPIEDKEKFIRMWKDTFDNYKIADYWERK